MPETTSITSPRLPRIAQLARYASVLLLLAMFLATHMPATAAPSELLSDKVIHFCAYMTLTVSLLLSWELSAGLLQPQHYFAVWLIGTLYGAFDEITQIPVGRTCDGLDWLADLGGIITGLVIYRILRPFASFLF